MNSRISPTLAVNQAVLHLRSSGNEVLHMGFGQAPFPTPERLGTALRDNAGAGGYLPVAGLPELQDAIVAHQARHTGIDGERFDVLVGPGSKALLYALQMAVPGDTVLPTPSWVSYAPQAALLGQRVVPVRAELGRHRFRVEAAAVITAVDRAREQGLNPTKLLINFPNNPTGLTLDESTLLSLVEACRSRDLALISDEIYGRLSFDHRYRSPALHYPEKTIVSTGLSKHLALGGWRFGVMLIPRAMPGLFDRLCHVASEIWSCVAAPVQHAAVEAYAGHADIEAFVRDSTDIHRLVNTWVAHRLSELGAECHAPGGGFYTWPNFDGLLGSGFDSSATLAQALLEQRGVATLPGSAFGDDPGNLSLRLSGCDYDGAAAMAAFRAGELPDAPGAAVAAIAPNVVKAVDEIGAFVASCGLGSG
jgi:aspartate aminotransferase